MVAARFGATATIAASRRHADTPGVDLHGALRPADRANGSVEHDAVAEVLGHPQRDQLRAADDAIREALLRCEELVRPARARDDPEPLEERERVGGLRQEAVGEVRGEVLTGGLVGDLRAQPLVERDRVELAGSRMVPRRLRVELFRQGVELRVTLLQGALLGG